VKYLEKFANEVAQWPEVAAHPHRFGGQEFVFGKAEIGHIHSNGVVDIPFPRPIRDALLVEGWAQEHHWLPNSGWATFRVRAESDLAHARWLLRLSYLRYALKRNANPAVLLERETEALRLNSRFKSLFEVFVPVPIKQPGNS
jgi:hypothetical protein